MGKIIEYKSIEDYQEYVKSVYKSFIGIGSEGEIYQTKDDDAIKLYFNLKKIYEPGKYIMADDIKLDSFIFPKKLYICNGMVCGIRMDYFKNNLFKYDNIDDINLDNLIIAREKFIEDIKVISKEGYHLDDLPSNILYDNKVIKAIDTLNYEKSEDPEFDNIHLADIAILWALRFSSGEYLDLKDGVNKNIEKLKQLQRR